MVNQRQAAGHVVIAAAVDWRGVEKSCAAAAGGSSSSGSDGAMSKLLAGGEIAGRRGIIRRLASTMLPVDGKKVK